jgi:predicted GIY-YIG superfamily endonuclease/3-methyladenine DNA glycosylase AlkD
VSTENNSRGIHTQAGPKFDQALERFEHWMYVVECSDGSLYTGYAKNVSTRINTHNAGRGAKYTKTRLPVKLVMSARFYTKERAMSAEAKFKMLTHTQKQTLINKAKASTQHEQNFTEGSAVGAVTSTKASVEASAETNSGASARESTKTNVETSAETNAKVRAEESVVFKKLLEDGLPNFDVEPLHEFIAREIVTNIDKTYRSFTLSLLPGVDPIHVLGVRTPALRKIATAAIKHALNTETNSNSNPDAKRKTSSSSSTTKAPRLTKEAKAYLAALPHASFEEMQVHSFMIASLKNYDELIEQYEQFIPHIDNWATCDQLATAPLMQDPTVAYNQALKWLKSTDPYTVRYGILVLMRHFLDELFKPELFDIVTQARQNTGFAEGIVNSSTTESNGVHDATPSAPTPPSPIYYMNMAHAWFLAEAFAKQPKATSEWYTHALASGKLDTWTARKAKQKAIESRKVSPAIKAKLKEIFY